MADIDVVPKKSGTGWALWVVVAIVAALIVWMLLGRGDSAEASELQFHSDDLRAAISDAPSAALSRV